MTHITGHDRCQMLLLPEAVDDYVGADNPVRFIDAFVDGLGSVEIHRELMTAAARWIMAWKLWSVLSARMAIRLNSFSLQKKFSIR